METVNWYTVNSKRQTFTSQYDVTSNKTQIFGNCLICNYRSKLK